MMRLSNRACPRHRRHLPGERNPRTATGPHLHHETQDHRAGGLGADPTGGAGGRSRLRDHGAPAPEEAGPGTVLGAVRHRDGRGDRPRSTVPLRSRRDERRRDPDGPWWLPGPRIVVLLIVRPPISTLVPYTTLSSSAAGSS